jgi:hypothetical protein
MSGQDTKPTPASGMPAAVAATSLAKPSVEGDSDSDEIRAPRSELSGDLTARVLSTIEQVRDEGRERDKRIEARFAHLEGRLDEVVGKTDANTKNIGEQAGALTRVASAAAKAADLALEAKQAVAKAPDDTTKLVESAIRIHSLAIAQTVDAAVKSAVEPLASKVATIEQREEDRDKMHERTNQALGAVVDELGIEDKVELGREVKPGEEPPQPALKKLEKRAKSNTLVQFVIAVGVIVNALYQLLTTHH